MRQGFPDTRRQLPAYVVALLLVGCAGGGSSSSRSAPASTRPASLATIATPRAVTTPPMLTVTPPPTTVTQSPIDQGLDGCAPAPARRVVLRTSDGVAVVGALLGHGTRGLVLAHEFRASLCSWVDYAAHAAARGLTVLAIDCRGAGESAAGSGDGTTAYDRDVLAGVHWLAAAGVKRITVGGASAGGTAALVAAGDPQVRAAFSLSGPADFGGMSATETLRRLRKPVLLIAGAGDEPFASDARTLGTLGPAGLRMVHVLPANALHGTLLLADPDHGAEITALVDRFLDAALH